MLVVETNESRLCVLYYRRAHILHAAINPKVQEWLLRSKAKQCYFSYGFSVSV